MAQHGLFETVYRMPPTLIDEDGTYELDSNQWFTTYFDKGYRKQYKETVVLAFHEDTEMLKEIFLDGLKENDLCVDLIADRYYQNDMAAFLKWFTK